MAKLSLNIIRNFLIPEKLIPEPEGGWFVRIKEFPNCMSQGDTPEEAMAMIEDAMRGWLQVEGEAGECIPLPNDLSKKTLNSELSKQALVSRIRALISSLEKEDLLCQGLFDKMVLQNKNQNYLKYLQSRILNAIFDFEEMELDLRTD